MMSVILWQSIGLIPLAAGTFAVLLAAVVWLYPPQVRAVPLPWRWALPGLRAAALAALAVSILRPVTVRPKTVDEGGAVVLLIDRSRSMGVTDAGRTPAEWVALADGLGLLPAGARAGPAEGIRTEIEALRGLAGEVGRARAEVDFAKLGGRGRESPQSRLTAAAARLKAAADAFAARWPPLTAGALAAAVADLRNTTTSASDRALAEFRRRIDAASRALAEFETSGDADLYQSDDDVRAACDELASLGRGPLAERGIVGGGGGGGGGTVGSGSGDGGVLARLPKGTPVYAFGFAGDVVPLPGLVAGAAGALPAATGTRTDLTAAVRAVADRMRGRPVQAIVLVSDGRQVGGETLPAGADPSGGAAPVFAVAVAPDRPGFDLAVARAAVAPSAFVGETVTVRAEIRGTGARGQTVAVTLDAGDAPQTKPVLLRDDGAATPVEFEVKFDRPGVRKVIVTVPARRDEATDANNRAERYVKVLSDQVRVAAVSGTGGWDFQYARNALARASWVAMREQIIHGGDERLALTPDELLRQDVILLSDVAAGQLTAAQWGAVRAVVADRGGSVILAAGPSHLPIEFGRGASGAPAVPAAAADLLPFDPAAPPAWRAWPGDAPHFRVVPARDAAANPAFRLTDSAGRDRWPVLPPVYKYLAVPASPRLKANTRALLVERDSGAPVLTESRLGLGRAFFLGIDETWRWRLKVGERDQDRFWLQLVRYAGDEPYAAREGNVRLDADRVAVAPGQPVRVRAKVEDEHGAPSRSDHQTLEVLGGGRKVRDVTLAPAASAGGRYEAVLADLPEGEYTLRLAPAGARAATRPAEVPLRVADESEAEMADLSGDDRLLRRIADASGGQFLRIEQLATLPDRLAAAREQQTQYAEYPLWDSPYLFLFVLACLGTEWGLRKRVGLA